MASIWQRIKNFLKRFYPLTIFRFNQGTQKELQKIQEIQKELQKIQGVREGIQKEIQRNHNELQEIKKIENAILRCMPNTGLYFEVSLAEHCNLNCAGCNHFSPLAELEFADYEETARDFARLSSLFHDHPKRIWLQGGEPLLHPDIIKFLKAARENFPNDTISITTNGLRLLDQPEEFWKSCKENKIRVRLSKYPIDLDYKELEKCAAEHGVEYFYNRNDERAAQTMGFHKMDVKGMQDSKRNFLHCPYANKTLFLRHGRLYTCVIAPTARHFSKYFGVDLKEFPTDSIDIYQAESAQEILEFLARPIPFCRYCMPEKTRWGQPWRQSERSIEEWT